MKANQDSFTEGKYVHVAMCWNCTYTREVYIPKGTPIHEHLKLMLCHSCGCPLVKPRVSMETAL